MCPLTLDNARFRVRRGTVFFRVEPPRTSEIPVVVEVPHAGLYLDPESLAYCAAPARSIGRDADLYVDELFARAPELGATLVSAQTSRYVCDLNRAADDLDAQTSPIGQMPASPFGVIWRRTTEGRPALTESLPRREVERRLDSYYRPYHATIARLLQEKRERFGYAVLLCGHSMPSNGRLGERRADVVPGSRGRTSSARSFIEAADEVAARFSYSVAHDQPYRGGFSTGHYGQPNENIHAVQIELARRLYMDEGSLMRIFPAFERCQSFCEALVAQLGEKRP